MTTVKDAGYVLEAIDGAAETGKNNMHYSCHKKPRQLPEL